MGRKDRNRPVDAPRSPWFETAVGLPACLLVLLIPFFPDEKLIRLKMQVLETSLLALWAAIGFRFFLSGRLPSLFSHNSEESNPKPAMALAIAVMVWVLANVALWRMSPESSVAGLELRRVLLASAAFGAFLLADFTPTWRCSLYLGWTVSAGVMAFYGVLQRNGGWGRIAVPQMERVMGTYGNPIFFAAFLAVSIFIGLLALRFFRITWVRIVIQMSLLLQMVALYFTQTRAAWIAVFGAAALGGLIRLKSVKARAGLILIALILAAGAVAATRNVWQRDQGHLLIWRDTARMWLDNPVKGVGLGGFHTSFPSYAGEDLKSKWPKGQFIVNYAHNEYLQLLAEGGLVGVSTFFAVLALFFVGVKRSIRDSDAIVEPVWLGLAVSAALIQNLFSVDMRFGISSATMFALIGLTASIWAQRLAPVSAALPSAARAVGCVVWAALLAALWPVIRHPYQAQAAVSAAPDFFDERILDPAKTIEQMEDLARKYPQEPMVMEKLAFVYAKEIKTAKGEIDSLKASQAIDAYQRLLELDPSRLSAHNNLANIYYTIGRQDQAIASWRKAIEIEPAFLDGQLNLGKVLYVRGDLKESARHFQNVLKVDPQNAEALVYLKRMVE